MGSNMAENHPVGFQWVVEARKRGAKVIHVDPRFTRTSALADLHVPLRAGSDIAFLGAIVRYILDEDRAFREYVVRYTNAATIVSDDFRDTEELDGLFSGWDPETRTYDPDSWQYAEMQIAAASGQRELGAPTGQAAHGAHGGALEHGEPPHRDDTLQDPRCVYQLLRRHFARYTPELVEETCGVPRERFLEVCEALCENSGRDRTSAFCYAVGWTQHTVGVQYIRTCWATSAGRAAASSRCAGTRRSRARRTSRRSTTSCRATCRCPARSRTRRSTSTPSRTRRRPATGPTCALIRSRC
jgi:formate dehydrogenase major subunit